MKLTTTETGPGKDATVPDTPESEETASDEAVAEDAVENAAEEAAEGADAEAPSTDDIEDLLSQASSNLEEAVGDEVSTTSEPKPFNLGNLKPDAAAGERHSVDLLGEVELDLRIELGRTQMRLDEVLKLRGGSVVALDKLAGDPVDIFVNGRLIAKGEVLVMNDNFCVRVTELIGV